MITEPHATMFHRDCQRLRKLFWALDIAKHSSGNQENAGKPPNRPTSKTPGGWASDADIDCSIRLRELVYDAKQYITPGRMIHCSSPANLVNYLIIHHEQVCQLDFVDGIWDEVKNQIRDLAPKLEPAPIDESNTADVKAPAAVLERIIFSKLDKRIPRKTISWWGTEGKIKTFVIDGTKVYSFWEVVRYAERHEEVNSA
ncbi:hypothetical protein QVA66_03850 [Staphylococcus chromogenes]|nr:hypothetical protein [Staphylococcus chromogenes]